jgi:hypothetical protein
LGSIFSLPGLGGFFGFFDGRRGLSAGLLRIERVCFGVWERGIWKSSSSSSREENWDELNFEDILLGFGGAELVQVTGYVLCL